MKTLLLLTAVVALVLAQVAPAQSTTAPAKPDPKSLVTQLVALVGSPTAFRGQGIAFQRMDSIPKNPPGTQTVSTVAPGSDEFGYGVAYGFKDGTVVRIVKDAEGRKGLEIWWRRSDKQDTGVSNTITVYHDGTFGYCMISGNVRYPSEIESPCGDSLPIQTVADEFAAIGAKIAEQLAPKK